MERLQSEQEIETTFFADQAAKPKLQMIIDEADESERDTLVDFDVRDATAFGVPRPLPLLRYVVVAVAMGAFFCVLEMLQLTAHVH